MHNLLLYLFSFFIYISTEECLFNAPYHSITEHFSLRQNKSVAKNLEEITFRSYSQGGKNFYNNQIEINAVNPSVWT